MVGVGPWGAAHDFAANILISRISLCALRL